MLVDSSRAELMNPRVDHDTLRGAVHGRPVAVPLHRVAHVSVRQVNVVKTMLLVGGAMTAGLITLLAATYNQ